MSIRLSHFESQLDFLISYYQFSIEFLTLKRIKEIAKLTKFINWGQMTETASGINTRALAEYIGKLKKGADPMSVGIMQDAQVQLAKNTKEILSILKELSEFHKEDYKQEIREKIFPKINLSSSAVNANKEAAVRAVKKEFPSELNGRPFFPELVSEALDIAYGPDAQELQQEILKIFKTTDDKPKIKQKKENFKQMLLESLRILANCSRSLDMIKQKIMENSEILDSKKKSFMMRVRGWLERIAEKGEQKKIYVVEYFDEMTSTSKTEKLDFNALLEEISRKVKLFNGIISKMGNIFRKIEAASEDQIFNFLNKSIREMQLVHRQLDSLDTFFKTEVDKEMRNRIRGIKTELTTVKNNIINANQKKHEYVSRKEEMEQMKKLGIDVEVS
jgi:hypothetical protein